MFSRFRISAAFKTMLAAEGGEHFLQKISKFNKKRVRRALKIQKKCRWHTKFEKLQVCCMQSFLLTGLWGLKVHKSWAVCKILIGARSEKRANRTSQGATGESNSDKSSSYEGLLGVKKVNLLMQHL